MIGQQRTTTVAVHGILTMAVSTTGSVAWSGCMPTTIEQLRHNSVCGPLTNASLNSQQSCRGRHALSMMPSSAAARANEAGTLGSPLSALGR